MDETNYCAHALDDSERVVRNVRSRLGDKWAAHYVSLYAWLRQAVKFRLPDDGRPLMLDTKSQMASLSEFHRLPYPCIALEYRMREKPLEPGEMRVPERLLLCRESSRQGWPLWMQLFTKVNGLWSPFVASAFISPDAKDMLCSLNIPKELAGDEYDTLMSGVQKDLSRDGEPLSEFLAALACSNVETQDTPPSDSLNKSRGRRGKTPFFTYKTLVLKTDKESCNGVSTGGHASPRVHLRRGHIRRLPDKRIWVNACVVGDKSLGMVVKDYRVEPGMTP